MQMNHRHFKLFFANKQIKPSKYEIEEIPQDEIFMSVHNARTVLQICKSSNPCLGFPLRLGWNLGALSQSLSRYQSEIEAKKLHCCLVNPEVLSIHVRRC